MNGISLVWFQSDMLQKGVVQTCLTDKCFPSGMITQFEANWCHENPPKHCFNIMFCFFEQQNQFIFRRAWIYPVGISIFNQHLDIMLWILTKGSGRCCICSDMVLWDRSGLTAVRLQSLQVHLKHWGEVVHPWNTEPYQNKLLISCCFLLI